MLGKFDQLAENQRIVADNQRKLHGLLTDISQGIQAKHEDLVSRLDLLNKDVLVNRKLIRERVEEKIRVCDGMRKEYADERVYRQVQGNLEGYLKYGIFPDYQGIREIFQASNPIENGCYEQLSGIFPGDDGSPHSYFQLETYKQTPSDIAPDHHHRADVEEIGSFLSLIYNPSLRFTVNHYVNLGVARQQLLSALLLPVTSLQALDRKHDRAMDLPFYKSYLFEALEHYLSTDAVLKTVWLLLDVYPLYHFVDNEGLLPIDKLKQLVSTGSLPNTPGKKWLETAKDSVEVAIAQQTLRAGDMLLPVLYERLHRASSTRERKQIESIRALLRNNPLLARNFMLYLVTRQLNEKLSDDERRLGLNTYLIEAYRSAIAANDYHGLRLILDESARYSELARHGCEKDGRWVEKWALKWGGDLCLSLPEADDLLEGRLLHTLEMSKLLELRRYLIEEIVDRAFVSNDGNLLNDSEYQLFNDLLSLYATESFQAQRALP